MILPSEKKKKRGMDRFLSEERRVRRESLLSLSQAQ